MAEAELICPDCGYDLHATDSGRCPECGWVIDQEHLARSHLPWTYRKDLGQARAFWRTVWLATWQLKRLAAEAIRPVDARDARRFATRVAAVLSITPVLAVTGLKLIGRLTEILPTIDAFPTLYTSGSGLLMDAFLPVAAGLVLFPVLLASLVLTAWLLTRAQSVWFFGGAHPRQRERASALSYYAAAPMAFVPVGIILALIGTALSVVELLNPIAALLEIAGVLLPVLLLSMVWLNTLRLLRRTLQISGWRVLATAIGLPLTWLGCAIVGLLAVPWVIGFVWLMIDSLRADP